MLLSLSAFVRFLLKKLLACLFVGCRIGTFCASCPSDASWDDIGHSRLGDFFV